MKYGFGVDLGGTTVKIIYFSETGETLSKWEIPTVTDDGGKHILPHIAAAIEDYITKNAISRENLLGIGIGVPGPVDEGGRVNCCVNLGWGAFNIQDELSRLTGLPVKAGNDANVAALGECWKGGGQGFQNVVMITLGTGVGGGIIWNGKIIHGSHGAGGEVGHLVINRKETEKCGCGKRGCVEQYCSATGIVRMAQKALAASDVPSVLRDMASFTCKDVFDASARGDRLAGEVLQKVYAYMGEFLANICAVVDPDVVVIGGGVSKAGQTLLDGIAHSYAEYAFHGVRETPLTLATLGNDAGAYGAFRLILQGN